MSEGESIFKVAYVKQAIFLLKIWMKNPATEER